MRSKKKITRLLIILIGINFFSCEKEKETEKDYVARVNEKYLTESELLNDLSSKRYEKKFREEYVRNWINRELLFSKAEEEGILNSDEFREIINISQKDLAIGLYLNEYYSRVLDTNTDKELLKFYESVKGDSRFFDNSYLVNTIHTADVDLADKFRKSVIENDWSTGFEQIKNDSLLIKFSEEKLLYEHQINSLKLLRALKRMSDNDVSPVIDTEQNNFTVVQLNKKFNKGDESVFKFIKDDLKEQYMVIKKAELEKALIENLYSENEVELKLENYK